MKTLLKILARLALLLVLAAGGLWGWASHRDAGLLGRVVATHDATSRSPFPLDSTDLDALRAAPAPRGRWTTGGQASTSTASRAPAPWRAATTSCTHATPARSATGRTSAAVSWWTTPSRDLLGPNLTTGAGGRTRHFTSSDWDRIVRHGVRHDGLPALMPSADFKSMSDQELSDIATYLGSLPAVTTPCRHDASGPWGGFSSPPAPSPSP